MSKTKIAVFVLATLMILSAFILLWVPSTYGSSYIIVAEKLTAEPEKCLTIDNPDHYVLQAISNPKGATVRSLNVTEIDELIGQQSRTNGASNFQINGDYYQFFIMCVDTFPPFFLSMLFLISLFTLPVSAAALAIITIVFLVKKRNKKV